MCPDMSRSSVYLCYVDMCEPETPSYLHALSQRVRGVLTPQELSVSLAFAAGTPILTLVNTICLTISVCFPVVWQSCRSSR